MSRSRSRSRKFLNEKFIELHLYFILILKQNEKFIALLLSFHLEKLLK
jgi:hypothetical protein